MELHYEVKELGNFKSHDDQDMPISMDAQVSLSIWVAQSNNASKIFAGEININQLEFKFNLMLKNMYSLSMDIVSITPSNVEVRNQSFTSNATLVNDFVNRIHTNHIPYFDKLAEGFGLPVPEKLFGLFEL